MAAELSCVYQTGGYLVMARMCVTGVPTLIYQGPPDEAGDYGLLGGFGTQRRNVHMHLAAGLGYTVGYYGGSFRTIGVPLEAGVAWTPLPFAGVGLSLFGNLNARIPFAGLVLHLRAGKLR